MRGRWIVLVTCAFLGACTIALEQKDSVTVRFSSSLSSEATYRNLLNAARYCYPTDVAVEAQFFPEAKEGELHLAQKSENFRHDWLRAKTSPAQSGHGTEIEVSRDSRFVKFDTVVPAWIKGEHQSCPYGTRTEPRPPGSATNQNNMPVR